MAELKGFTFTVQAQGNFVIHAKNVEEAKELAQSNIAINGPASGVALVGGSLGASVQGPIYGSTVTDRRARRRPTLFVITETPRL